MCVPQQAWAACCQHTHLSGEKRAVRAGASTITQGHEGEKGLLFPRGFMGKVVGPLSWASSTESEAGLLKTVLVSLFTE